MLPCTNCGNSLDIIKGTVVQCFACGKKNSHFESFDELSSYVQEIFGYPKLIEKPEENLSEELLNQRMSVIDELFNDYISKFNRIDSLVVSKISEIDNKFLSLVILLAKNLGMLKIIIELYILPHLKGKSVKQQYAGFKATCEIYHSATVGLRHTIEAKNEFKPEIASEYYEKARWNFQSAVDSGENYSNLSDVYKFQNEIQLFQVASQYCNILKDVVTANPAYHSDLFEELTEKLDNLPIPKARILKNDILIIYDLANELPKIMEEVRTTLPIKSIDPERERILYHSEEVIETADNAKIWIKDVEDRYKYLQTQIMKLHSGQLVQYLRNYRTEFQNRLNIAVTKYNDLIKKIVQTALLDYTLYVTDLMEELENGFSFIDVSPSEVIERARYIKNDMTSLDDDLKEFLFTILDFGIPESLKGQNISSIVSSISDKHTSYDKLIYQYLKKILDNFISVRDEKRYTIEEQRSKFNIELRPLIDNLLRVSFTITEDQIPYPVFIEVVMLTTQLEVEKEYKVFFVIENPSKSQINNVNVSFFVPNNFKIRTSHFKVGKIKSSQKLNVETRIVADDPGVYYFMAMLQYEYSSEMFWMPSIKQKIRVLDKVDFIDNSKEDGILAEIYKKYGQVVNYDELEVEQEFSESPKANSESIQVDSKKKLKDDDLLPDL